MSGLQPIITNTICTDHTTLLQADETPEEIQQAMFAMKEGKAPGPDSFAVEFFKRNREVEGF